MQIAIINQGKHPLPEYKSAEAAGMDMYANVDAPIVLAPLERILVPTGIYIQLPKGYEAQLRPRSGMAYKQGITLLNSPGTIDSDYRGEIKILCVNISNATQTINDGDRIAQMIIAKHETITWQQVETLNETNRGEGGFGHTGINNQK